MFSITIVEGIPAYNSNCSRQVHYYYNINIQYLNHYHNDCHKCLYKSFLYLDIKEHIEINKKEIDITLFLKFYKKYNCSFKATL